MLSPTLLLPALLESISRCCRPEARFHFVSRRGGRALLGRVQWPTEFVGGRCQPIVGEWSRSYGARSTGLVMADGLADFWCPSGYATCPAPPHVVPFFEYTKFCDHCLIFGRLNSTGHTTYHFSWVGGKRYCLKVILFVVLISNPCYTEIKLIGFRHALQSVL